MKYKDMENEDFKKIPKLAMVCLFILLLFGCFPNKEYRPTKMETQNMSVDSLFDSRIKYCINLDKRTKVKMSFPFQNKTKRNISIDTVKTFCGCTKVMYPKYAIRPNGKDSIYLIIRIPKDRLNFSNSAIVYFKGYKPTVIEIIGNRQNFNNSEKNDYEKEFTS